LFPGPSRMIDMLLSSSNASVTCDDVRREQFLQHILASLHFKTSPRVKAFLIYLCESCIPKRFDEASDPQAQNHPARTTYAAEVIRGRTKKMWLPHSIQCTKPPTPYLYSKSDAEPTPGLHKLPILAILAL
jgi:hypothetical protein